VTVDTCQGFAGNLLDALRVEMELMVQFDSAGIAWRRLVTQLDPFLLILLLHNHCEFGMSGLKAANMRGELRRLPTFGLQIGMALHTELVSYRYQGLTVAAVFPVAGDAIRGELFARLMHQTSVTHGAGCR
jgi:hypothetical protein